MMDQDLQNNFTARLIMAAKRANITQSAISRHLKISSASVNLWFKGRNMPSIDRIAILADILNVNMEWLITGREDTPHAVIIKKSIKDSIRKVIEDKTDKLLEERERTHGNANDTFTLAANLISTMFPSRNSLYESHEFALMEIQHKISRIINGSYHPDHWDDIEGYARLGKKLQEGKELERSSTS